MRDFRPLSQKSGGYSCKTLLEIQQGISYGYPAPGQGTENYEVSQAICLEDALLEQVCECPSHSHANGHSGLFCELAREAAEAEHGMHRDVSAAARISKLLGERLLLKDIPAISIFLKREQKYHGKVKAVIDSLQEVGVKLI